jgi:hypothetical protein
MLYSVLGIQEINSLLNKIASSLSWKIIEFIKLIIIFNILIIMF